GRTVYGGGGVMSDIFIPLDTIRYNKLYSSLIRKGVVNGYVNEYLDKNRKKLMSKYSNFTAFNNGFEITDANFSDFLAKAKDEDIEFDDDDLAPNANFIRAQLKALIARNLYEPGDYFEVIFPIDSEISKAIEVINDNKLYNELLLN
ncbi:MAG: peptidase S41, partial [Bacteroidota bacterium]